MFCGSGKKIDFVANPILEQYPNQFSPYCAFGCDMRSFFKGTLFRFPLRTKKQGSTSKLSKQSYTAAAMLSVLKEFEGDAVLDMLFLKHVEQIEVRLFRSRIGSPFV